MRVHFLLLLAMLACFAASGNQRTYVGSTPAHNILRAFLHISATDSIDFIRWKLDVGSGIFKLQCQYGLAKAGTPGFINEQEVSFGGELSKTKNNYHLTHQGRNISILEVNANVFHFLDDNNDMLVGNGGYSYALNSTNPIQTNDFNIQSQQDAIRNPLVFEGRTPCQELSLLLGLNKGKACDKMKWYFLFYSDPATGKPSYYLKGGIGYRKETMERGSWRILTKENGRTIYQVNSDKEHYSLNLLKGDDNILFFTDAAGRLLVGNENFSYTLNRRKEEYARRDQ